MSGPTFCQCYRVISAAPVNLLPVCQQITYKLAVTRHDLLTLQLTCLISSTTVYPLTHYDHPTNCYFQYCSCYSVVGARRRREVGIHSQILTDFLNVESDCHEALWCSVCVCLCVCPSVHLSVCVCRCADGVFLNVSTTYARTGSGYVVPSACAKAGVEAFTKYCTGISHCHYIVPASVIVIVLYRHQSLSLYCTDVSYYVELCSFNCAASRTLVNVLPLLPTMNIT